MTRKKDEPKVKPMFITLRLYKRSDLDLLALQANGIDLKKLAKFALIFYAKGIRMRFILPKMNPKTLKEIDSIYESDEEKERDPKKSAIKIQFPVKEPEVIELLNKCKKYRKNLFIKTLIRNTLLEQSLGVFFEDNELIEKENEYLKYFDIDDLIDAESGEIANLLPIEEVSQKKKQYDITDILKGTGTKRKTTKKYTDKYAVEKGLIKPAYEEDTESEEIKQRIKEEPKEVVEKETEETPTEQISEKVLENINKMDAYINQDGITEAEEMETQTDKEPEEEPEELVEEQKEEISLEEENQENVTPDDLMTLL